MDYDDTEQTFITILPPSSSLLCVYRYTSRCKLFFSCEPGSCPPNFPSKTNACYNAAMRLWFLLISLLQTLNKIMLIIADYSHNIYRWRLWHELLSFNFTFMEIRGFSFSWMFPKYKGHIWCTLLERLCFQPLPTQFLMRFGHGKNHRHYLCEMYLLMHAAASTVV